jgi:protein-disulfide isomerase
MIYLRRPLRAILLGVAAGFALAAPGCGGRSMLAPPPAISVSLAVSTVVVSQDGMEVIVPIQINSTSETALVAVSGLPAGVQQRYAASDTSPSGDLIFTGSSQAPVGTYTPTITVHSAGATASTQFKLIVTMAAT